MANISLGEGLLAVGSGLFKGLNANRAKREADRQYEDEVAYKRSRQAIEDQYTKLKLDNEKAHEGNLKQYYDTLETPEEKAARDAAKGKVREYVANTAAATARLRAAIDQQNNIRTNTRISASDRARLLASQAEEIGREMRNLRDVRTQLTTAKTFAGKNDLPDILGGIAEADSMLTTYGSQAPGLYKSAGEALNSAPVQPVAPYGGDGTDVLGADENAIETLATQDQMGADQFSGATLGQALQPQAAPQQQPSLGSTLAPADTAGVPAEVVIGIMQRAAKLRPDQAAGYVKAQLAKYKADTGAR